ncbi:hypothetical protein GMLC_19240 [Geomonas limicola]|uniref:Transcriptional regulator n=1 Tax=Geomonas limicola TaxID=2740186 RepID=A0A6V8N6Y8_9BACT|nr:FMN-binding negative transcriptional regulator [Geomonas limicola]GFO68345.1 hypothetical protein GMLC_19240 [Geomonas limicola]
MFIPNHFSEERIERLHALIRDNPFGLLVTHGASGLQASPLPFALFPDEGEFGVLRAHLSRANPHWQEVDGESDCLVMFQGENGYVTPSWYPSKAQTHRQVPTWNYCAVEVRGTPTVIQDPAWLHGMLEHLVASHEGKRPHPWSLGDAATDYLDAQLKAIVGIEIPIRHIEGKWKMSQNKSEVDRLGVVEGLRDETDPHQNLRLADLVDERLRDSRS